MIALDPVPLPPPESRRPDSAHSPGVELSHTELSTYLNDRKPGIQIDAGPLVDPAVFIVDDDEFYLRADWAHWYPVSDDEPGHLKAIASYPTCVVTRLGGNEVHDCTARVYRIAKLPDALFAPEGEDALEWQRTRPRRGDVLDNLARRISECGLEDDPTLFRHVVLDGESIDAVVSTDEKCIVLGVMPPEFDGFREVRPLDCSREAVMASVGTFVDRMQRYRRILERLEPSAGIDLALLDYGPLVDWLESEAEDAFDEARVNLFPIEEFEELLHLAFS